MSELYLGLMSGTSCDGIDAALVDFGRTPLQSVVTHYEPYPDVLREKILALSERGQNEIERLGELDILLGKELARTACTLLKNHAVSSSHVKAVGSHGQTIRHCPHLNFTLQIGDPNVIAAETGITTVADFRRRDLAHGGCGAPLVPAFHHYLFTSDRVNRAIVNIGGIANVTFLSQKKINAVIGFDTGPGNVLMDAWINLHQKKSHDVNGEWGAQGIVDPDLLERLLSDNYFERQPPKSTGREYFNLTWLQNHLRSLATKISPVDVQATLIELTARSIMMSIRKYIIDCEILICGGGVHNQSLMTCLRKCAGPQFTVHSTQKYGIDPDWIEATAFAWLARQTLNRHPGNLPRVTGAKKAAVLGGIYYG